MIVEDLCIIEDERVPDTKRIDLCGAQHEQVNLNLTHGLLYNPGTIQLLL